MDKKEIFGVILLIVFGIFMVNKYSPEPRMVPYVDINKHQHKKETKIDKDDYSEMESMNPVGDFINYIEEGE